MKQHRTAGFTIIELLIATVVFSVVLLTISAGIIQIGRLYYKGITSARTQEAARLVMDDIATAIQFNTGDVVGTLEPTNGLETGSTKAVCLANRHISYALGQQRKGSQNAVVERTIQSGCQTTDAQNLSSAGTIIGSELLGENMRLANLVVKPVADDPNLYQVTVRVVYGDSDLLCNPSKTTGPESCSSSQQMPTTLIPTTPNLSCKNIRSGTQFCAASELSTIVKRRLVDE